MIWLRLPICRRSLLVQSTLWSRRDPQHLGNLAHPNCSIYSCPIPKNNATALYIAVQHNRLDVAKFLMREGADPNISVTYGMTPLICAVHHNHRDIAEALLSFPGVEIDATVEDGSTALFFAVNMMLPDMVELLVAKGADVSKKRKDSFNLSSF